MPSHTRFHLNRLVFRGTLGSRSVLAIRQPLSRMVCALWIMMPGLALAQNTINEYAGGSASTGVASTIDLPGPSAAIRDSAGNTYIAAPYSNYVYKLNGGNVTVFAGTGVEGYNGDGIAATSAQLAYPNGLAIDSKGNIYISEFGNPRIRMVNPAGIISTVAGNGTRCEPTTLPCGDGGPASQANFNLPMGVETDAAGNIYIADSFDDRIRVVNMQTTTINVFGMQIAPGNIATIAGNGNPCANPTTACGDGLVATSANLNFPQSITFDSSGNLYIADTHDNKIRVVSAATNTITTIVGTGGVCVPTSQCGDTGPATLAKLHMPMSVILDSSNNIYIADAYDHKIRFVNNKMSPPKIFTVAGTGVQGFNGDGLATSTELNYPASVFLDGSGNLVFADNGNQRVRQIASNNISSIVGGGNGGDGGSALSAVLANPNDVAEDASGNIYIADTSNNRIRMVNAKTGIISTVAGTGIAGWSGDGGAATGAALNGPTGVAVDSSGNIWIADAGNYVIRKVSASTQQISTYAGMPGQTCYPTNAVCGDGGAATAATFTTPESVAVDQAGNLFIADYNGHRVRKVVPASPPIISTYAGTGVKGGTKGNGGPATQAHLNHPSSVAVDSTGNLYIDDSYNNMIRRVDTGGIINDWALNGAYKFSGDGGPALSASQWNPLAIALDPSGNLFIGGGNNHCVRRVDILTYTIGTVSGDVGQHCVGGFSGDGGPAIQAKVSNIGMAVDSQSNLYLADTGNNRIRVVHLTPAVKLTNPNNFGAWPIGTTSTPQTFTITSTGGVDLNLSNFTFGGTDPGDFAFAQTGTCTKPSSLGVDESCTVALTMTPQNYGSRTATLLITDNGPGSPQSVNLSGFGPYFTVTASPTTLTINPGSAGNSTLTIAPFGGFNQTVNLVYSGCSAASGLSCSITPPSVTLDGTHSQTATLTIQTSSTTPAGKYHITATGEFGAQNQLQWSANLTVTV